MKYNKVNNNHSVVFKHFNSQRVKLTYPSSFCPWDLISEKLCMIVNCVMNHIHDIFKI